jgi:hypothetical protein
MFITINYITGHTFSFDSLTGESTLLELKMLIESKTNLSVNKQRLLYYNKLIDDDNAKLKDYGFHEKINDLKNVSNYYLHLIPKLSVS